ncbi:MAG: glycosyltransferase [Bacteroidota bacterium]
MSPDLLLIAPYHGGHHAEFVRWLLQGGRQRDAHIVLAASSTLLSELTDDLAFEPQHAVPLASADALTGTSGWAQVRATATVLNEASRVDARRSFLMYLDQAIPPLALGLGPRTDRMSGLLFRSPYREADPMGSALRLALRRRLLQRAGRQMDTVFSLDPEAPALLQGLGLQSVYAPDPVEPSTPCQSEAEVRAAYGVEPGRRLAVLFGSLEERKGLFALADALCEMDVGSRLAVVVAGRTYPEVRPRLVKALARVEDESDVQVIFREGFLSESDLVNLTAAADVVLAPYLGHVGSSGVVLRSAAAGTPLIAQSTGQIGREVRQNKLGWTLDPADTSAFARTLGTAVAEPTATFDPADARRYVEGHQVDRFTSAILDRLLA